MSYEVLKMGQDGLLLFLAFAAGIYGAKFENWKRKIQERDS